MKTYTIAAPLTSHWRDATCDEVACTGPACTNCELGWKTIVDEGTALGQEQAHYIRKVSDRPYLETREETGLTVFEFAPGQKCFAEHEEHSHKIRVEREELFVVQQGDWRGNPRNTTPFLHSTPDNWVDDFATHQDHLAAGQR